MSLRKPGSRARSYTVTDLQSKVKSAKGSCDLKGKHSPYEPHTSLRPGGPWCCEKGVGKKLEAKNGIG